MKPIEILRPLFQSESHITIPPGEYAVPVDHRPLGLRSGQRVLAHGARFRLPEVLSDRARLVVFEGADVCDFRWEGGTFIGHCFDPSAATNTWEPNVNTRGLVLTNSPSGVCRNVAFRDVQAQGIAGAVIGVHGLDTAPTSREVRSFAENVSVHDCTLTDCGKFMWDYGFLWQILGWPEEYTSAELRMAERYFPKRFIAEAVVDADQGRLLVEDPAQWEDLCFIGENLPKGFVRGRRYAIGERGSDWVRVITNPGERPLAFTSGSKRVTVIHDLHSAFMALYAPEGAGPGKGGIDLTACRATMVSGNRLSARGDTMHMHSCHTNIFANNHILGSRMGAFFLSEWCKNSTITGNTIDGTNGSRVMSVEKSNQDVTIIGNTFRGGGRGSWINQPQNIVIQGNIFVNNTTKGEEDPRRGRRSYETGEYQRWAELYFTTHEEGGRYGPVILRDNIFVTGPEALAAVEFQAGGHDIEVSGNVFHGETDRIIVDPDCRRVNIV